MKILFIAGGQWQKSLVSYLKNKGETIAIVNPVKTSTTELADVHLQVDVNNLEEIKTFCKEWKPDFVTSDQSDISTLTVAKISDYLGLPGNSVESIEKLTDKFEIYKHAKSLNLPVPQTKMIESINDIKQFGEDYKYPIIIKPVDSTMSRGFRKINNHDEVTNDLLDASKRFSKSKRIIAQTYVAGDMITLDGVCANNKHKTLTSSIKYHRDYFKAGVASSVNYPASVDQAFLENIITANDLYVEKTGMKFGLTHSEYIVDSSGFYLIEIGGRGGGAGITDKIVPWVSGVHPYDVLYSCVSGNPIDVKSIAPLRRPALLRYFREEDIGMCNEEKEKVISAMKGVAEFHYNFIGKQYVSDSYDNRHTMGIFLGETREEIEAILERVREINFSPNT